MSSRLLALLLSAGVVCGSCSTSNPEPGDPGKKPQRDAQAEGDATTPTSGERDASPGAPSTMDAGADENRSDASSMLPPMDAAMDDAPDASLQTDAAVSTGIMARGDANTLDIGCWNLEWFGSTSNGPMDEATQLSNAAKVIAGTDLDIWGLAEIVSKTSFDTLQMRLPGYAGIVANDPKVTDGATYYDAGEQKVALMYKTSVATLVSAKLILTDQLTAFAGRPPLEASFEIMHDAKKAPLTVIVLHAKAASDMASWTKRSDAATALKGYLDAQHPSDDVIVIGDFNDIIQGSITSGQASPYASFVSDADYKFVTQELASMNIGTTVGRTTAIDHHLVTDELYARYVAGSVQAYRVDSVIMSYAETTSDHYPVLSRYSF